MERVAGLTLAELLVVLAVLALLSALAVPALDAAALNAKRRATVEALNPNDAEIVNFLGDFYARTFDPRAEATERRAVDLDPLHAVNNPLGSSHRDPGSRAPFSTRPK